MDADRKFVAHVKSCAVCKVSKSGHAQPCPDGIALAEKAVSARWGAGLAAQRLRMAQENALVVLGVRKSSLERFERKKR